MKYVRRLMESRPVSGRVPDQSIIIENNLQPSERVRATRGNDYLFIYTAAGKPFTVNLGKIPGNILTGFWFDPKTGESTPVEPFKNSGIKNFTSQKSGYGRLDIGSGRCGKKLQAAIKQRACFRCPRQTIIIIYLIQLFLIHFSVTHFPIFAWGKINYSFK